MRTKRPTCVTAGPHVEPHQCPPPLGRHQRFEPFGIGVNEDEPDDLIGVGAGVEADEEAAQRVAGQDIEEPGAPAVSNGVRGSPRLGDGVAAACADIAVEGRHRAWSIIGANADETGHAGKNQHPRRPRLAKVLTPDPGRTAVQ
jgi:hypothetical protein